MNMYFVVNKVKNDMKRVVKNPLERKQRGAVITLCMVCVMFFAAVGCGRQETYPHIEDEDEGEYGFIYTDEGKKEFFTIRKDKVIIKTDSEADAKALIENKVFIFAYDVAYVWVLATIDSKKTTLDDLMKIDGVVDATYGLEYVDGSFVYPSNQISVKCIDGKHPEDVLNENVLNNYVVDIELFDPISEIYIITLNLRLAEIMQFCRDLYESGLYIFSAPVSYREMKFHVIF